MGKTLITLISMAILSTQPVFADEMAGGEMSEGTACAAIAKSCLSAGFTRDPSATKKFWQDCMKPIILGKTVAGVTIDHSVAKTCREHKIEQLKHELKELQ